VIILPQLAVACLIEIKVNIVTVRRWRPSFHYTVPLRRRWLRTSYTLYRGRYPVTPAGVFQRNR